ncbi:hypothetical protein SCHPADRAFT_1000866 [Schizopora paradoxa]|uniref:Uncharacterized protein n=1 Tax=Schizopora paradoxa TaxID=27342 RepID=A0A0H2RB00_9AGAM|nr:hypothetical protein SCHPADRAFT_1000866 [Schizopora paradoxa]
MASSLTTTISPAILLNEAAAAFIKAANHALTLSDESSRVKVASSVADELNAKNERDALRNERDQLMRDKVNLLQDAERVKMEIERWKSATEKAEWTVSHQADTIKQLRREAQQWREQFLRVDEERTRLSARVDELVLDQLSINRRDTYMQEPMTPRSQGHNTSAPTSADKFHIATGTTSTSSAAPNEYETDSEERRASFQRVQHPEQRPQSKGKGVSHPPPRQTTLIRRVHAIVTVPVKEEEDDEEEICQDEDRRARALSPPADLFINEQDNVAETSKRATAAKRKAAVKGETSRRRKGRAQVVEEDSGESQDEHPSSGEDEASDDENDASYVPNSRRDEDDEDELMIGVEDNRKELYGSERVVVASRVLSPTRRAQTRISSTRHSTQNPKRRNSSPYPNATTSSKKSRKR